MSGVIALWHNRGVTGTAGVDKEMTVVRVRLFRTSQALPVRLAVALVLAGCASSGGSAVSTVASTLESTTSSSLVTTSSTAATTTSSATTTTAVTIPPTTTTVVAAEPLVLRNDGLGPFDFGSSPTAVIDAITAMIGSPSSNDVLLYEDPIGGGLYESRTAPYYFALPFPIGQTACWSGSFCAEFGGASAATLGFIGWTYTGPAERFATRPNLTIGSKWSNFPSMSVFATCYTTGGGTHSGISLILSSPPGWEWLVSDGVGGFVENLPDPTTVRVTQMQAGSVPFQVGADC